MAALRAGAAAVGKNLSNRLTRKTDASVSTQIDAFREGLRDLGWVEGRGISIEHRDAEGEFDRLRVLAAELVNLNVDVIVTVDTPPTQAAQQATRTIPIVIAVSADPVGAGLVGSLAHPGGNATGINFFSQEVVAKRLRLLHELVPKAVRFATAWAVCHLDDARQEYRRLTRAMILSPGVG